MRMKTLLPTLIAFVFSGAAAAGGGDYGKDEGARHKEKESTPMAVEKIDDRNAVQAFNKADEDSDFKLSKEEAARIQGLKDKFAELDEDGDGTIDYGEFRALTQTETGR